MQTVEQLQLPARVTSILRTNNIIYIDDLCRMSCGAILNINRIGLRTVHEIVAALEDRGYPVERLTSRVKRGRICRLTAG